MRRNIKNSFDSFGSLFSIADNLKQNYGEEEKTTIRITSEEGGIYYIALRAIDSRGKKSGVSNIVMAFIKSNVKIQSTTAFAIDVSRHPGIPISNVTPFSLSFTNFLFKALVLNVFLFYSVFYFRSQHFSILCFAFHLQSFKRFCYFSNLCINFQLIQWVEAEEATPVWLDCTGGNGYQ